MPIKSSSKLLLATLLASASFVSTTQAATHEDTSLTEGKNPTMVYWGEEEGIHRLESSKFKVDFFKLANHFEGQSNKMFCGPTSAAIVLNALRVRNGELVLPEDPSLLSKEDREFLPTSGWSPLYARYSQNNVFAHSPKTRQQVLGEPILDDEGNSRKEYGFQLHQLGELMSGHGLDVKVRIVDEILSNEQVKQELIANLGQRDDYVIINYHRKTLGQPGGGHLSPLAAYHQGSDSFLILDVTPNKADWVWVRSDSLIAAMRTFDSVANRGYLLIRENTNN